jgi:O-antigen ligase
MGNFGQVTPYRDRAERSKGGAVYDTTKALEFAHGHSLFLNALAERGLVGLAALLAWLGALGWSLVRERPAVAADDHIWLVWGAAASAWIVTVGVGLVNTTLHHEHGILAALLLGMWLSRSPKR